MWYMYGRRVANHGLPYLAMTIGPLAQQWANHESCHRSHATLCSSSPSRNKGIHHLFHHPRTRTSAPGRQTWWKWMLVAIVCGHQLPQVDCSVLGGRADGCPPRWRDARNHLRCASTPILFLTASCQRQCFSRDIKDCQKSKTKPRISYFHLAFYVLNSWFRFRCLWTCYFPWISMRSLSSQTLLRYRLHNLGSMPVMPVQSAGGQRSEEVV